MNVLQPRSSTTQLPTIRPAVPITGLVGLACADHLPLAPTITELAEAFVTWAAAHGLGSVWTVDDIWFLAEADFAPALNYVLPPRRVFLGALQKVAGVAVAYDRRLYRRDGRLKCKTTVYTLPAWAGVLAAAA